MTKIGYSQGIYLTDTQRDSAYSKIQRGKINAEKVRNLLEVVKACDSASNVKTYIIGLSEIELTKKDSIILNAEQMIIKLEENVKIETKRGRRRGFWNFIKGTGFGIVLLKVLTFVI